MPRQFFGYCSLFDIKDALAASVKFEEDSAATKFTDMVLSNYRTQANAELRAFLSSIGADGAYYPDTTTSLTAALDGATENKQFAVTTGTGGNFPSGSLIRIHGLVGSHYRSEYLTVVAQTSDNLTVPFARNSYSASDLAVVELITAGMQLLRTLESLKVQTMILSASLSPNDESKSALQETKELEYKASLQMIREHGILDGVEYPNVAVESLQIENADDDDTHVKQRDNLF